MSIYNTTQLDPDKTFERHVYHRDQFAHYLRWTHILKNARIGMNILDWGSGTGNLLQVFYRNRYKCEEYLGLEYRANVVQKANIEFMQVDWARFEQQDLTVPDLIREPLNKKGWDMIVSFEVAEHVGKDKVDQFLKNLYNNMTPGKTTAYLSTPVYDPRVGAAANHIIGGTIGEMTYKDFKERLERAGFTIEKNYGTFASQRDYTYLLNDWQKQMYAKLSEYYNTDLLSNIMAPFFPEQSRNVLWVCKRSK